MATIFISWGSPDRDVVKRLQKRLQSMALDIFFSDRDMHGGDDPNERVPKEIESAAVALIFLSNESAARPWVNDEAAMCVGRLKVGKSYMKKVIPIRIGPLDVAKIPRSISETNLHIIDMSDKQQTDEGIGELVNEIIGALGHAPPVVVPAALFAMNKKQFQELLSEADGKLEEIKALCAAVGLDGHPNVVEFMKHEFSERYGISRDDFAPFNDGSSLVEMIDMALERVNLNRASERKPKPPIFLRWDHSRLLDHPEPLEDWFIQSRRNRSCLTIVDSISAFHSDINKAILSADYPRAEDRSALVWIPPYSRKTASLENLTKQIARAVPELRRAFLDWEHPQDRWVCFDTSTIAGFQQWLRHALRGLAAKPGALLENVKDLENAHPSSMNSSMILMSHKSNSK